MNAQYYQLKNVARKKSQPVFPYKLRLSDFVQGEKVSGGDTIEGQRFHPALAKAFNIHGGAEEWSTISHIVVNEDGLKMPVSFSGEESAIAFKFVMNPTKIENLDDLYDSFEVNKGTNVKYVMMCNPGGHKSPSDMTLQQKLFRKFFYENSSFIDSEVKFIEITNERVAARVGLDSQEKIQIVQNENPFGSMKGSESFKLMNLNLERIQCDKLMQEALEKKYAKYLKDFSRKEFESEFLLGEERIDEVF